MLRFWVLIGLDDEDEDSNVGKMPPSDSESDEVDA
jgi:hypothetical protein